MNTIYVQTSYLDLAYLVFVNRKILIMEDDEGIEKDDWRAEREESRDGAAEFSGFRRRWRLLGWVVRSQLTKRERKTEKLRERKREREKKKEEAKR